MFQKALQFRSTIVLCYNKQTVVKIISWVLPPLTWQIFQTIVNCLSPIVLPMFLISHMDIGFLVMLYIFPFPWVWKLRGKNQLLPSFESLMDDDSIVSDELSLLAFNIRKEVINVLDSFLSFLKVYDKKKTHNMISSMLDLRYKKPLYSILICWKGTRCCSCWGLW
jgi:hypothetical protein